MGSVKLHTLYHAGRKPVYGLRLIDELARHGHAFSAGIFYPMLHALEQEGLLRNEKQVVERKLPKYYHLTMAGREALNQGREKAMELLDETRAAGTLHSTAYGTCNAVLGILDFPASLIVGVL